MIVEITEGFTIECKEPELVNVILQSATGEDKLLQGIANSQLFDTEE